MWCSQQSPFSFLMLYARQVWGYRLTNWVLSSFWLQRCTLLPDLQDWAWKQVRKLNPVFKTGFFFSHLFIFVLNQFSSSGGCLVTETMRVWGIGGKCSGGSCLHLHGCWQKVVEKQRNSVTWRWTEGRGALSTLALIQMFFLRLKKKEKPAHLTFYLVVAEMSFNCLFITL